MNLRCKTSTQVDGTSPFSVTDARKARKPSGRWMAIIGLGILFGSLTLQAEAAPAIYLYVNGAPVNVTATYSYQQHYLYDAMLNPVATVDDSGRIFSPTGQQIGYLTDLPLSGSVQ
jgi:hypothetical protein